MPSFQKRVVVITVGLLLLLAGCSRGDIVLNDASNGRPVQAAVGQKLVIELSSNPTTGYTWQVNQIDTNMLRQIGEPQFASHSNLPGSGGIQTFTFDVVGSGSSDLSLVYQRPWEEGIEPIDIFILHVTVE